MDGRTGSDCYGAFDKDIVDACRIGQSLAQPRPVNQTEALNWYRSVWEIRADSWIQFNDDLGRMVDLHVSYSF